MIGKDSQEFDQNSYSIEDAKDLFARGKFVES